jgi:hypothetical protein
LWTKTVDVPAVNVQEGSEANVQKEADAVGEADEAAEAAEVGDRDFFAPSSHPNSAGEEQW